MGVPVEPSGDAPAVRTRWGAWRPLPLLGASLALGALAGTEAARAPVASSGWTALAGVAAAFVALAAGVLVVPRGRFGGAAWLAAVGCLGFAHGARATRPAAPSGVATSRLAALREGVLAGRWKRVGVTSGYVEAAPGLPAPALTRHLLLRPAVAPPDGSWVAVLPGGDVTPWPRGPAEGPARREGDFLASSRVHADELVALAPGGDGSALRGGLGLLASRARDALNDLRASIARAARPLESDGDARGLVAALLLGRREGVSPATLDLFTRTGTRHMLALSGLHVGLVAGALVWPATALLLALPLQGRKRAAVARLVALIRLGLLTAYVAAAGMGDPVTRAGAALAVGVIGTAPADGVALANADDGRTRCRSGPRR